MKYEVIFIDVDNTILDFDRAEVYALEKTCKVVGYPYSEAVHRMYDENNYRLWQELEMGKIDMQTLKKMRFVNLVQALKIDFSPLEMSELYMSYLGEAIFEVDKAYEVCQELSKICKLIVVTNGITNIQRNRFAKSRLRHCISDLIISEEVGCSKPNPKIFEIAMEKAQIEDKKKILMIGDSLTSDMRGGQAAGIDTCFYNPRKIHGKGDLEKVQKNCTYEITHLSELLALIV